MRPINNVVDASNYVMLELGQPTHPYDLDRLAGGGLRVRAGQARGDAGHPRRRRPHARGAPARGSGDTGEDCLICDAEGVAGRHRRRHGRRHSEIAETTTRVLLEAAYFTPMAMARTAKRLGLRTEASARFERGCDPWGIDRAAGPVLRAAGPDAPAPTVAPGTLDVRGDVPGPFRITVPVAAGQRPAGHRPSTPTRWPRLLEPIGFGCEPAGTRPAR